MKYLLLNPVVPEMFGFPEDDIYGMKTLVALEGLCSFPCKLPCLTCLHLLYRPIKDAARDYSKNIVENYKASEPIKVEMLAYRNV